MNDKKPDLVIRADAITLTEEIVRNAEIKAGELIKEIKSNVGKKVLVDTAGMQPCVFWETLGDSQEYAFRMALVAMKKNNVYY